MVASGQTELSIRQLFGVSLLSGVGSVPYQILPLIIAVLIDQSRTSVAEAGIVGSAILLGQLVAVSFLANTSSVTTQTWFTATLAVMLVLGLWLTVINAILMVLFGWFIVG